MKEVIKILEKRRDDYLHILEHHKHELSGSQLNQTIGAIKEVEFILETIAYHLEQKRQEALAPEQIIHTRPDILTKISMLFKH